jgi:chromosome segregation ATPase
MKIPWLQIEPDEETKLRLLRMESILTAHTLQLTNISVKENKIMADIANLTEDLIAIKAGVSAALAKIEELKAQIAAITPGAATQEQIDALDVLTEDIKSSLSPDVPPPPPEG